MNDSWAKVVLDSVAPSGVRLTTVELHYWRMIHSEIMTHRDRARNSASSRAVPFYRKGKSRKTAEEIRELSGLVIGEVVPSDTYEYVVPNCTYTRIRQDPFVPEFIGAEQAGMQSGGELSGPAREEVERLILEMRDFCLSRCLRMHELGAHKSIVNRYVEPWSYITVVMTATDWRNFFRLRVHPKAEKHFHKIASQVQQALMASVPRELELDQWHMPYIREGEGEEVGELLLNGVRKREPCLPLPSGFDEHDSHDAATTEVLKRVSAGRCARVSYLTHDGKRDFSEDLRLFEQLIHPKGEDGKEDDAIHASALEHTCRAVADPKYRSGPFRGWHQLRKDYPNECAVEV